MSCCGAPVGMERVWQFVKAGAVVVEHAEQAVVLQAQQAAGGGGRVQRITRRAK